MNVKKIVNKFYVITLIIIFIFNILGGIFAQTVNYKQYKKNKKSINVYNWGEYLSDGSNGNIAINKEFEKLTGIKVNYSTFASNEELYAKLRNKSAKYDVVIPSDYMVSRMIKEGMLEPIDFSKILNYKNIDDNFKNLEYDKKNEYSVPYMWGTVGIVYNKAVIKKPIDSWNALWDEAYKGKILMFSNSRDSFGIALKKLGYSINSTNESEILKAAEEITKQKKLVQAYVMDEIFNKMENEEAIIAPYYSGDAITMMKENKNLDFVHPKEGTNIFVDAMCIPKDSENIDQAYLYINFLLEPKIALANAKHIGYSTPNKKAFELLADDVKYNKIAYPSQEILSLAENFVHLPDGVNKLIDAEWTKIMSINNVDNKWLMPVFVILGILTSVVINICRIIRKKQKKILEQR